MKIECIECTHFKSGLCVKNQKNGYNNCKKFKAIPIQELQKEYKLLLVSGDDAERLEYLKDKITYINGGYI